MGILGVWFLLSRPRYFGRPSQRLWVLGTILTIWMLFALRMSSYSAPSVWIIVASANHTDSAWAQNLTIPNSKVLSGDNVVSIFNTAHRGPDAVTYLSYFYTYYEALPDVSIMIHGDDESWSIDCLLESSTAYALNHLVLAEVESRLYVNLGIEWNNACPDWINTTSRDDQQGSKPEQPIFAEAFLANFPNELVPELLAQPHGSQFAVSKRAIRSVPRELYKTQIEWLTETQLEDDIVRRFWNSMWQYLFLNKAVYCPEEYKALCRGWHICYESEQDLRAWYSPQSTLDSRHDEMMQIMKTDVMNLPKIEGLKQQIAEIEETLVEWKATAILRGQSSSQRKKIAWDL